MVPTMNSETPTAKKRFRYSLWDLVALTTYIAVLLGLPYEPLGFLVAVSWACALLLAVPAVSGLVFGRVNQQPVSRTMHESCLASVSFSARDNRRRHIFTDDQTVVGLAGAEARKLPFPSPRTRNPI